MDKKINSVKNLILSQTARSAYLTTFGAGLNAFSGFLFTIIIARSLNPADFGYFSVIFNLIGIFYVICDIGLSSATLRYLPQAIRDGKEEEGRKIIKFSFMATALIGAVITILLVIFSSPISDLILNKKQLSLPLAVAALSVVGIGLSVFFTSILQAKQKFAFAVITDSSVVFLKVIGVLLLFLTGNLNLVSIFVVYSLTSFSGFIIGLNIVKTDFLKEKIDFDLARILVTFGAWIAIARIANVAAARIDTLMLIRYVSPDEVGFYAAAQKMTFIFPVLVTGLTVVMNPVFSSFKTNVEALRFAKKAFLLISGLYLLIGILFVIAPFVTVQIFGPIYAPASNIFRWLLISSTFFIASSIPTTALIYFLGKSRVFAVLSFLQLAIIFCSNLILIPKYGVIAPAISLAIAYGIIFIISLVLVYLKLKKK